MKLSGPKTLRYRMLVLTLLIVTVPMLLAGYVMKTKAEEALLAEKQAKLFFVARLLNDFLGPGGFDTILKDQQADNADRAGKIRRLNQALAGYTDLLASSMPGLGVGYYSRDLDAIVTYGPSSQYAGNVGHSIPQSHPGRRVMAEAQERVEFGSLVRGNIMNAMLPIERAGRIEGYIWANELTDDIQGQLATMSDKIYLFGLVGLLISLILMLRVSNHFAGEVETIKRGLDEMQYDLSRRIPSMSGETGEIAASVNQMAQAVQDARKLNENILYSISDGIVTVDNAGRITMLNQAAQDMTGYSAEEVIGQQYSEVVCSQDKEFHSLLLDTLQTGTSHVGAEIDYPTKKGYLRISVSSNRLKDGNGRDIGAVVVFRDLTEQIRLQQQMLQVECLAATDSMTGLLNRRAFLETLRLLLLQVQAGKSELSLAFLDLDDLKKVNDTCGHQEGDWYIKSVASLLREHVREGDIIGRLGGDEFAVILPQCSRDKAAMVLKRIEESVTELEASLCKPYTLGISVGLVHIPAGESIEGEEMLSQADAAMYRQKGLRHQ